MMRDSYDKYLNPFKLQPNDSNSKIKTSIEDRVVPAIYDILTQVTWIYVLHYVKTGANGITAKELEYRGLRSGIRFVDVADSYGFMSISQMVRDCGGDEMFRDGKIFGAHELMTDSLWCTFLRAQESYGHVESRQVFNPLLSLQLAYRSSNVESTGDADGCDNTCLNETTNSPDDDVYASIQKNVDSELPLGPTIDADEKVHLPTADADANSLAYMTDKVASWLLDEDNVHEAASSEQVTHESRTRFPTNMAYLEPRDLFNDPPIPRFDLTAYLANQRRENYKPTVHAEGGRVSTGVITKLSKKQHSEMLDQCGLPCKCFVCKKFDCGCGSDDERRSRAKERVKKKVSTLTTAHRKPT